MPGTEDTQIMPAPETTSSAWKIGAFDAAVKIAIPVLLAMCSWLFSEVQGLKDKVSAQDQRIAIIEATQLTKSDGDSKLGKIAESLARLEVGLVRTTTILDAFADKLDRVEAQVEDLRQREKAREPPK